MLLFYSLYYSKAFPLYSVSVFHHIVGRLFILFNVFDATHRWQNMLPLRNDAWNHIVLAYSQLKGLNMFVNTVKVTGITKLWMPSPSANVGNLMIGSVGGIEDFRGAQVSLDSLAIWYKELQKEDVKRVYLNSFGESFWFAKSIFLTISLTPLDFTINYHLLQGSFSRFRLPKACKFLDNKLGTFLCNTFTWANIQYRVKLCGTG